MPAFNQKQIAANALNANKVTILIGDQPVGFAQTFNHAFDFGAEGYYGVGSAMPQEIQQLRVSPNLNLDKFTLTQAGLTLIGQTTPLSSLLANTAFSFFVVDAAGNALYTYVGATCQNFSQNIAANRPVAETLSFLALDVLDNTGQSILNVGNAFQLPSNVSLGAANLGITGGAGVAP